MPHQSTIEITSCNACAKDYVTGIKMPQVKGSATWLSNTRQQAPNNDKGARIDNSVARIENEHMGRRLGFDLDFLQSRKHKSKADIEFDIKQTMRFAEDLTRMRKIVQTNRVDEVMKERRRKSIFDKSSAGIEKSCTPPSSANTIPRPRTSILKRAPSLQGDQSESSHVRPLYRISFPENKPFTNLPTSDDENEDDIGPLILGTFRRPRSEPPGKDYYCTSDRVRSGRARAKSANVKQKQGAPKHTANRKCKSAKLPKSLAQSDTVPDYSNVNLNTRRPRSAWELQKDSAEEAVTAESIRRNPKAVEHMGRSFQELKDLTHIDRITETEISSRRAQIIKIREAARTEEQRKLQQRINDFYKDLDTFKSRSKNTNKLSFL